MLTLDKSTFIQVRIKEQTKHGEFNDCLYYSQEQYETLTDDDIAAAKQSRVDNWVAFLDEQIARVPEPIKPEDLQAQADELTQRMTMIVDQMKEVGSGEDLQALSDKLSASTDEVVATISAAVETKRQPIGVVKVG